MGQQTDSPGLAFMRQLYKNSMEATGHSWLRLNSCMFRAVFVAIEAGLVFGVRDFLDMGAQMNGHYWFHDGGPERWYATAVCNNNRSAWKALEHFFGRAPFLLDGKRMYVGLHFDWDGLRARVTSFAKDGAYLVATVDRKRGPRRKVPKKWELTDADHAEMRTGRRYKITREQLRAKARERGAA